MKKRWEMVSGGGGRKSLPGTGDTRCRVLGVGGNVRRRGQQEAGGLRGPEQWAGRVPRASKCVLGTGRHPERHGQGFSWGWGVISERWLCSKGGGLEGDRGEGVKSTVPYTTVQEHGHRVEVDM